MNFIPDAGDRYYFATHAGVHSFRWDAHSTDLKIVRHTGSFPSTQDGKELANWQHAFLRKTPKFWEWVDDYELHT